MSTPDPIAARARSLAGRFEARFGRAPEHIAYAPGRVEVLGNHTDYNDGLALAAAIDRGTLVALAATDTPHCRIHSLDLAAEAACDMRHLHPLAEAPWANYVIGMAAHITPPALTTGGFEAMIESDLPIGAGLSSSAALEMASGLALAARFHCTLPPMELARAGRQAEHVYAGVRCGLLDQITSLYARTDALVRIDFRSLTIDPIAMPPGYAWLVCRTHRSHRLTDDAYNERRAQCEAATQYFRASLSRPEITALRDISLQDLAAHGGGLEPLIARRAAHPIGEMERVRQACAHLAAGDVGAFGQQLWESHESSVSNFENSSPELDAVVAAARQTPGVLGARLTGGGFGGSVLVLTTAGARTQAAEHIDSVYRKTFGSPCEILPVRPSAGARLIPL